MTCLGCVYAKWDRTATGRLHPNKQGRCTALEGYSMPELPAAFYWLRETAPKPSGGYIFRDSNAVKCSWRKEEKAA